MHRGARLGLRALQRVDSREDLQQFALPTLPNASKQKRHALLMHPVGMHTRNTCHQSQLPIKHIKSSIKKKKIKQNTNFKEKHIRRKSTAAINLCHFDVYEEVRDGIILMGTGLLCLSASTRNKSILNGLSENCSQFQ